MTFVVDMFISAASALETKVLNPLVSPFERAFAEAFPTANESLRGFLAANQSVHAVKLPLMNPFHVLALCMVYLAMVFGGKYVMQNFVQRKLDVKLISNLHNAFLVWLSAYMCGNILYQAFAVRGYSLFDNPSEEIAEAFPLAKHVWLFYFSKVFEFVDTLIMVAKMSFRQISFLHVYHHSSIFAIWWISTFIAPTGETYFSAALNSFIHVVMYSYYLFTSLGMFKPVMQMIKPFITLGQLTQFCMMMVQASYDIAVYYLFTDEEEKKKKYPIGLIILLWVYMWTMLGLFANFYVKSYKSKPAKKKEEKDMKEEEEKRKMLKEEQTYLKDYAVGSNLNLVALKSFALKLENEAFMNSPSKEAYLQNISSKITEVAHNLKLRIERQQPDQQRQQLQQQQQFVNANNAFVNTFPQQQLTFNPVPPTMHQQMNQPQMSRPAQTNRGKRKQVDQLSPPQEPQSIVLKTKTSTSGDVTIEVVNGQKRIRIPGTNNPLSIFVLSDIEKKSLKSSLDDIKPVLDRSSAVIQDAVTIIKTGVQTDQSANLQKILRTRTLLNLQTELFPQGIYFLSGNTVSKIKSQFLQIVQQVEKGLAMVAPKKPEITLPESIDNKEMAEVVDNDIDELAPSPSIEYSISVAGDSLSHLQTLLDNFPRGLDIESYLPVKSFNSQSPFMFMVNDGDAPEPDELSTFDEMDIAIPSDQEIKDLIGNSNKNFIVGYIASCPGLFD